jgi:hypothetical protein
MAAAAERKPIEFLVSRHAKGKDISSQYTIYVSATTSSKGKGS